MDYKIIIILILLVTIYSLYYLKFSSNWIIAFSVIAILIMNEIINDKEYFSDNKLTTMRLLQTEQNKDIEYLENQLSFIKGILKEKHNTHVKKNYFPIKLRNSCIVMNSDNTDTPNNDFESKYDFN